MWEKIAKEMQLPWRAAEAMHWQIGEVEMAHRANVPVFHLAGQQGSASSASGMPEGRVSSTSPSSLVAPMQMGTYSHTHSHSLPQIQPSLSQPVSPVQTRLRQNSGGTSPHDPPSLRRRADSARSVPTASAMTTRTLLPPVTELAGPSQVRYTLPPVVTLPEATRR